MEKSTIKSLFEQFDGAYRKENDYAIPNIKIPETENFEIGIYGQWHLYFCINLLLSKNPEVYLREE